MPTMIGMSLTKPLAHRLTSMVTSSVSMEMIRAVFWGTSTAEPSPVLPRAMFTATGARMRPMTMITGPVTMGGRTFCSTPTPYFLMSRLKIT